MASERSLEVLRVIVQDYVASSIPVGSKSIVERHAFGVSAATIRSDMALLEEEELITAPHTSSGRIPTDKGYRVFVDQMADLRPLSAAQRHAIETFLGNSSDLDEVLSRTVRLLSQLTQQVALVQYPSLLRSRIRHIEIVSLSAHRVMAVLITDSGRIEQRVVETPEMPDEPQLARVRSTLNALLGGIELSEASARLATIADAFADDDRPLVQVLSDSLIEQVGANRNDRLVMAGTANLARTEHDFTGSIFPVLEAIEEQVALLRLFGEMEPGQYGMSVRIGRENEAFGLSETSVVAAGYTASGGGAAQLGVLGPTRMDYSSNMAAIKAVARYLTKHLDDI